MSPVTVCQVCAVEFTYRQFVMPLAQELAQRGYQVHAAFTPEDLESGRSVRNLGPVRHHPVAIARSASPMALARSTWQLYRLFRRHRFTVVHVHTPVAAIAARLAACFAQIPVVLYTAHGFYFHDRMPLLQRWLHISIEAMLAKLTSEIFTVSSEDADLAVRLRFKSASHIHAIANGVDPVRFKPANLIERRAQRKRFGVGEDALVIGIVARLVAEKGYRELIAAFVELADRYPQAQLLLCGSRLPSDHAGDVDADIAELQKRYPARVFLTGSLNDPEAAYQAMDIFCLPSWREGLPCTVIEAMLSALPVVATDIRGCREQVSEGINGLLVPPQDPICLAKSLEKLLLDRECRMKYGDAGRMIAVERYNISEVLERQARLYKRAIGNTQELQG